MSAAGNDIKLISATAAVLATLWLVAPVSATNDADLAPVPNPVTPNVSPPQNILSPNRPKPTTTSLISVPLLPPPKELLQSPFLTVEPAEVPTTVPNAITVERFKDVSQDSSFYVHERITQF